MPNIFKEVLFNNGEGIAFEDENNLQRFLYAMINDGILSHSQQHSPIDVGGMSAGHLYAIGNSAAVYAGASNRQSRYRRGMIFQRIDPAVPTGDDAKVLGYYFSESEADHVHAAAVTNPRWDLVSIGLFYANADTQTRDFKDAVTGLITGQSFSKQRRVAATITVTPGAENASPVEPALPAGHVKIAALRVSPGMTTFDPTTDIRDYRMPLGPSTVVDVPGMQWAHQPAQENIASDNGQLSLVAAANATAICTLGGSAKRLVTVGLGRVTGTTAPSVFDLVRISSIATRTTLRDLLPIYAGAVGYTEFDVLASHGTPLWSNGFAAGYANSRVTGVPSTTTESRLGIRMTVGGAAGPIVTLARFVFVG